MSQEKVFSDFSGGMNALAAVDKLDPKECLVAENIRLDETGNILSAGATTPQNTAAYAAAPVISGTNTNTFRNVHSLFWNPALGAVAGVGEDVFTGPTLGGMTDQLVAKNVNQQKMSFGSAYNRVYFDVGNIGYWTDMTNLLTVDWPPPVAQGSTVTGPTVFGTAGTTTATGPTIFWTNPQNINGLNTNTVVTASFTGLHTFGGSNYLRATMTTNSFAVSTAQVSGIQVSCQAFITGTGAPNGSAILISASLIIGGTPVGSLRTMTYFGGGIPPVGTVITLQAGGNTDLWGLSSISQAQINAGSLGAQFQTINNYPGNAVVSIFDGAMTIYQGGGFIAAAGTAGNLSGTYSWKITFVDNQGEESDASNDSNTVVLASQQGTLTGIETGDARTTSRNIYRLSTNGALTSHYLVGAIPNNIDTTYSDNQSDINALAEGVILAGDVPGDYPNTRFNNALMGAIGAPAGLGRFPTLHYDRIFWINPNKTNQIFWSKPLNGFAYPSVNFINVGDGKAVTRLISIFGELIIIKTDSIWRLTGTDESSFNLTQTPSVVGTDEPFTVVALPDKVVFSNRYGIWVFNGYTSVPLTTKLDPWFKQLNRDAVSIFTLNGFAPPEVAAAVGPPIFEAVGNSEKYAWAYGESGSNSNNSMLLFDLKHGNITKRSTSTALLGTNFYSLAIDQVNGYVYMGDGEGFVSLVDDWNGATQQGLGGTQDGTFDYQHGYQDLQRGSNISLWAFEFFLNTHGQSLTPSIYYDSGANSETLAPIVTTGLQRVIRTVQATNARKLQNFSWRLFGSINPINITGVPQIQVVHVKALYDVRPGRARTGQ